MDAEAECHRLKRKESERQRRESKEKTKQKREKEQRIAEEEQERQKVMMNGIRDIQMELGWWKEQNYYRR